jgi:hypothetical protein
MVAVKSFTFCLSILVPALLFSLAASSQSAPVGMEVAPGLHLTSDAIVWVLERPDTAPALHPLARNNAAVTDPAKAAPSAASAKTRDAATLHGPRATVRIHAGPAAFYVQYSKAEDDENHKPPPSAPIVFSIIRLRPAPNRRIVAWYENPNPHQTPAFHESVIEATASPSDDFTWLKITPAKPLPPGEYAIVQRVPAYNSLSTWIFDFGVD